MRPALAVTLVLIGAFNVFSLYVCFVIDADTFGMSRTVIDETFGGSTVLSVMIGVDPTAAQNIGARLGISGSISVAANESDAAGAYVLRVVDGALVYGDGDGVVLSPAPGTTARNLATMPVAVGDSIHLDGNFSVEYDSLNGTVIFGAGSNFFSVGRTLRVGTCDVQTTPGGCVLGTVRATDLPQTSDGRLKNVMGPIIASEQWLAHEAAPVRWVSTVTGESMAGFVAEDSPTIATAGATAIDVSAAAAYSVAALQRVLHLAHL